MLLRGNGTPVFLLANVVDDIEMGITHVVRAEEHLPNTPKQQLLWEALGHEPPVWAHVPVLVNEQRKKLSKRRDKVALEQYRDEGYLADAMVNYLMTLGWAPPGRRPRSCPWAVIERDVPAGGRHPLAGVLRHQEARRVQRRVHPHAVASTSSSPRASRAYPPTYDRERVRGRWRRTCRAASSRSPTRRAMVDFLFADRPGRSTRPSWDKAMRQPWSRAVLVETADAVRHGRRGTRTR